MLAPGAITRTVRSLPEATLLVGLGLTALCTLLSMPQPLKAQIAATRHNLSVSGPGAIKADTEQEICKFCHIPHRATPAVPLWDHTLSSVSYAQYTSSTSTATYETQYPGASSKLCLSCHDGTIAIGSTTRGLISVAGGTLLDADQSLAAAAGSNLGGVSGAALTDDHPISIGTPHFTASQYACNGCHYPRPSDIVPMECVRCHDPHTESNDPVTRKFLVQSNANSALCRTCHNKAYWATNPSIHESSTKTVPAGLSHTNYTTVASNGCESCHKPHTAAGPSRLLKAIEEMTCERCHSGTANGGITEKNVSGTSGGPFAKVYRHPTYGIGEKHRPVNASPVTYSPTEQPADLSMPNRHAECFDCHNAHAATSGLHTVKSNLVSNVLSGVWGLEPTGVMNWTQPTAFVRIDPATREYQVCMKCHSYYGLGSAPTGVTTIIGPSGTSITDQAMEFNINNYSAHPVVVGLNSQTGSYAPAALTSSQLSAAWNSPGAQTMYCSDCHGNDQPTSATVPQGPHGSNYRFLLAGTAKYWPTNASGGLWSLDDIKNNRNAWQNTLFCVNCHPLFSGMRFENEVHQKGMHQSSATKCITCHIVVPHGSKRSRLIGYASDVRPYNYSGAGTYEKLVITGFRKATGPNSYSRSNCSMNSVCHGTQSNIYDP